MRSGMPKINRDELNVYRFMAPSKEEQILIGRFMLQIGKAITLQQRKVEKLLQIKEALLEKMFPKAGVLVPDIRFSGFTGDWEQRKLGELALFSKGNGYSKADLREAGVPIILYGRLYTRYETVIKEVDTFAEGKEGAVYSHGGEVIVPASGETAEDIAIASVVERPGVILGGDLNVISPNKDIDSAFLALSISNGKPHNDMAKRAQGKSVVHLHNEDLAQIDLCYPSMNEQQKISACIAALEKTIALQQRKMEKLQRIKKALLEKMFV